MPNYHTHDKIGLALSIPAYIVGASAGSTGGGVCMAVGFLFGTLLLSPDLDTHSVIQRRWYLLKWIWTPYRELIPHRSIWSHSGFSALLRVVYLYGVLRAFVWIVSLLIDRGETYGKFMASMGAVLLHHSLELLLFLIGVVVADIIHVVADLIWSFIKFKF